MSKPKLLCRTPVGFYAFTREGKVYHPYFQVIYREGYDDGSTKTESGNPRYTHQMTEIELLAFDVLKSALPVLGTGALVADANNAAIAKAEGTADE